MFCPYAFGTFAIDVAVVVEPPCSVIEQKPMAGAALMRRKKDRARINLVIAWRDRRSVCGFFVKYSSFTNRPKHEKKRD